MQTGERRIIHRLRHVVAGLCIAAVWMTPTWAQSNRSHSRDAGAAALTSYGPGVAGQVIEGPTTPVCRPNVPCTRPFANATILVLDGTNRNTVGTAVTNAHGNFIVSVPPGAYLVHVQVVDLPRCPEIQATVGPSKFTAVQVSCDTGIR